MRFGYLPLKKENNRAGEAESKVISKGGWDWKLGGVHKVETNISYI